MQTPKLAIPVFVGGPREEYAAVDVYTESTTSPISNISTIEESIVTQKTSGSSLLGSKSMKEMLGASLSFAGVASKAMSQPNLMSRLSTVNAGLSSAMKGLPPGLTSSILGGIKSGTSIAAVVAGVSKRVSSNKLGTISSLGMVLNAVSANKNTFGLIDKGATVGSMSGLITTLARNGIPNSFGSVVNTLNNQSLMNQIGGKTLNTILKSGDFGSFKSMATSMSPGSIKAINPNVINDFSSSFSCPAFAPKSEVQGYFSDSLSSLSLIDPNWNSTTRSGNDSIMNLTGLQGASSDFNSMFRTGYLNSPPSNYYSMLLAPAYPKTDVYSQIGKQFPNLALIGNNSSSSKTIDPRAATNSIMNYSNSLFKLPSAISTTPKQRLRQNEVQILTDGSKFLITDLRQPDGSINVKTVHYSATGQLIDTVYNNATLSGP